MKKKIIILGAGVSGLSYGYYLKKFHPNIDFEILENSSRLGGMVFSEKVDGGIFEWGPRGIRPNGKGQVVLEMIEDLGLWDNLIFADDKSKKRYLYHDGSLNLLPYSIKSLIFSPYLKVLLRACYQDLRCSSFDGDESVADYADRHFGKSFRRLFFDSMINGIWAGNIKKISISAVFPLLKELELEYDSLIMSFLKYKNPIVDAKQYPKSITSKALFSFEGGLEVLVHGLKEFLSENILFNVNVDEIKFSNSVHLQYNGKTCKADMLVSTIPAFRLAPYLSLKLKEQLDSISYAPLAVLNLIMKKSNIKFDGYGLLVPSKENSVVLGMVANQNIFPKQVTDNLVVNTVMMGGERFSVEELKEMDLKKEGLCFLEKVFKRKLIIEGDSIILFDHAIPQYELGHLKKVKEIEQLCPPSLKILGNYMYGVSLINIVCKSKEMARNPFN